MKIEIELTEEEMELLEEEISRIHEKPFGKEVISGYLHDRINEYLYD